ncbi:MAG TPA: twin-arginine translocase TatA/TatE family subunit [Fimbriimonadaceae bacterium]|nr:twin-arginine translocase TatA/TatE family subunit [Fimbriimonadaceae bacterium]
MFEPSHLIILAIVALLLFGGERFPELMRNLGKGMGDLKRSIEDGKRQLESAISEHQVEEPYGQEIKFVPPTDTVARGSQEEKHTGDH